MNISQFGAINKSLNSNDSINQKSNINPSGAFFHANTTNSFHQMYAGGGALKPSMKF
jgi:hypothetical protein